MVGGTFLWLLLPAFLCMFGMIAYNLYDREWGAVIATVSGIIFVAVLIIIPVNHMYVNAYIHSLEQVRMELNYVRNNATQVELAAMSQKVIEFNKDLAEEQYFAGSVILSIFYPRKLLDVKPIR